MKKQTTPTFSAFISYASTDKERAFEICESLEQAGHTCWIAPRNVHPGKEYGEEIITGIEHSRCLVLVLSEAANNSTYVKREVERAVSKNKPVFPVRIEEVMPSPAIELFVSTTHWIDAWSPPFQDHWNALSSELNDQDLQTDLTAQSKKAHRKKALPKWIGSAVAVMAIIAGVAVTNQLSKEAPVPQEASNPGPPEGFEFVRPTPEKQAEITKETTDAYAEGSFKNMTGRELSTLSADDFNVTATDPDLRQRYGISIKAKETISKALANCVVYIACGESDYAKIGTLSSFNLPTNLSYRKLDQKQLVKSGTVKVKLQPLTSSRTLGPFEYQVDLAEASFRQMRELALESEFTSRECSLNDHRMSIRYRDFWPVVRAIHFGWSKDAPTNHQLRWKPKNSMSLLESDYKRAFGNNNCPENIPVRYGAEHIHFCFELDNGEKTQVHHIDIGNKMQEAGVVVRSSKHPESGPLTLLVGASSEALATRDKIDLSPILPFGATDLRYSFDENGFFETKKNRILAPALTKQLRLSYKDINGQIQGPFIFEFDPLPLIKASLKAKFLNDIEERLVEKAFESGNPNSTEFKNLLNSLRLPKDKDITPPILIYTSAYQERKSNLWLCVKSVEMGTAQDQLKVVFTPKEPDLNLLFSDDKNAALQELNEWFVSYPIDTSAIFVRYTFFDGEQTDIIRLK